MAGKMSTPHAYDQPMALLDKLNWYGCIRDDDFLTHGEMLVAHELAFTFHNSNNGACFPRDEAVAFAAGVSRGIVILARNKLRDAGYLEWQHSTKSRGFGQGSNRYRLTPPGKAAHSATHFRKLANEKTQAKAAKAEERMRAIIAAASPAVVSPAEHHPGHDGVQPTSHQSPADGLPGVIPGEQQDVQSSKHRYVPPGEHVTLELESGNNNAGPTVNIDSFPDGKLAGLAPGAARFLDSASSATAGEINGSGSLVDLSRLNAEYDMKLSSREVEALVGKLAGASQEGLNNLKAKYREEFPERGHAGELTNQQLAVLMLVKQKRSR